MPVVSTVTRVGRLSRRRLLGGALGAGVAMLRPGLGWSLERDPIDVAPESLARVTELFAASTVVDFHTHLGIWHTMGLPEAEQALPAISRARLEENIRAYIDAGVTCIYLDTISDILRTRLGQPGNKDRDFLDGEAWADYLRQFAMIEAMLETLPLQVVTNVQELESVRGPGRLAAFLSTEGAHMVEGDPQRLETLYAQGFRRLQPIHYVASELGDSQTDAARFGGLSDLGREVLSEANKLGMLLDLAHASLAAVEDTAELVDKPLALSHTMVAYESKRFGDYRTTRQRWISPEHARIIAETGGVIGTFPIRAPYGVDTLDAFVEALLVMVETVGIDHVAWSTDLGEPVRPAFLQDYRQFPRVCARLLESGFTDEDLMKFVSGNALRVQAAAA